MIDQAPQSYDPLIVDVAKVGANSPNDSARTQVGQNDPYRYCAQAPHVANEDNMGGGKSKKGGY